MGTSNSKDEKKINNLQNIDNNDIIENDCYEEIRFDKIKKILKQEKKWNNNSIIYTYKDQNFLMDENEKMEYDQQNDNKSDRSKKNKKITKLIEECPKNECSPDDNLKQQKIDENNNIEKKDNNENKDIIEKPNNQENIEKKESNGNNILDKNNNQKMTEAQEKNCNNGNNINEKINDNIKENIKENNGNNNNETQKNNEIIKNEVITKDNAVEKNEDLKNNGSNQNNIKNEKSKNDKKKSIPKNKKKSENNGNDDAKTNSKNKNKYKMKPKKSNSTNKSMNKKIQKDKIKEKINVKVRNRSANNSSSNNKKVLINKENVLGEHKNINNPIDIHYFISEYKLTHLKDGDIVYSGLLEKVLHIPEKNSYSYSERFCVLTKNEFSYYKSKEYYISVNKPMLVVKNSYISSIEQLNSNTDYYYFIIVCEINDETKDFITKVNSFVTNEEGKYTNLLLSFRNKSSQYINRWVAALRYFINQK